MLRPENSTDRPDYEHKQSDTRFAAARYSAVRGRSDSRRAEVAAEDTRKVAGC